MAGSSDGSAASAATAEAWARSLVGRDWEIYWKESDDGEASEPASSPAADDSLQQSQHADSSANGATVAGSALDADTRRNTDANADANTQTNADAAIHGRTERRHDAASPAASWVPQQQQQQQQEEEVRRSKRAVKKSAKLKDAEESMTISEALSALNAAESPSDSANGNSNSSSSSNGGTRQDHPANAAGNAALVGKRTAARNIESNAENHAVHTSVQNDVSQDSRASNSQDNIEHEHNDTNEGDVIDDWYAGRVLSYEKMTGGKFLFQVLFVGDDQVYEMDNLDSTKVRPSAIGWIKRSIALLDNPCSTDDWSKSLPPDTSMVTDTNELTQLRQSVMSELYETFNPQEGRPSTIDLTSTTVIQRIQHYRYLLLAQIYLRSQIAKIINHHGSSLYVDGEPNPTEPYVDHLTSCLRGLEQTCSWFCSSWKLLQRVSQDAHNGQPNDDKLHIDHVVRQHLERGRNSILFCMQIDSTPAAAGKRKGPNPLLNASSTRRTKRRKKTRRLDSLSVSSSSSSFDQNNGLVAPSTINEMIDVLNDTTVTRWPVRWCLFNFGRMLNDICEIVVRPVLDWQQRVSTSLSIPFDDSLLLELNETTHRQTKGEGSAEHGEGDRKNDDMSTDSDGRKLTYEEIESCLTQASVDPTVRHFCFDSWVDRLSQLLSSIRQFQNDGEQMLRSLLDEPSASSTAADPVVTTLQRLLDELNKPNSLMAQVEPVGKAPTVITEQVLRKALAFRTWFLGLRHAESTRERPVFFKRLSEQVADIEDVIDDLEFESNGIRSGWVAAMARLNTVAQRYRHSLSVCDHYYNTISAFNDSAEARVLLSTEGIRAALNELAAVPYVSLAEELLTIRHDILEWSIQSDAELGDKREGQPSDKLPAYSDIQRLFEQLRALRHGISKGRSALVRDLEVDQSVEEEVRAFVERDLRCICGPVHEKVQVLHESASKWKERTDAVLNALLAHRNAAVADSDSTEAVTGGVPKGPGMVDIKRIYDLISEYESLGVDFGESVAKLRAAYEQSLQWKAALDATIVNYQTSFSDCLEFVAEQSNHRPHGIIMEPTRTTFDLIMELIGWYKRAKSLQENAMIKDRDSVNGTSDSRSRVSSEHTPAHAMIADGQDWMERANSCLLEAHEIAHKYVGDSLDSNKAEGEIVSTVTAMRALRSKRKTIRAISLDRLMSSDVGMQILTRMIRRDVDLREGGPLQFMIWMLWHAKIAVFVGSCSSSPGNSDDAVVVLSPTVTSHDNALSLLRQEPDFGYVVSADSNDPSEGAARTLRGARTPVLKQLDRLIAEAQNIADEIRRQLAMCKELVRNTLEKQELIRSHLVTMKELLCTLKTKRKGGHGLSLSKSSEPQLELQIKMLNWLTRTFPYPMLYLDEATYSALSNSWESSATRIPWEVLVSLYERIPGSVEDRVGDFALVILRVTELYHAAKAWQDEITKNTMLSFRGGKRRSASGSPPKLQGSTDGNDTSSVSNGNSNSNGNSISGDGDGDSSYDANMRNPSKIELQKVERLANNPVLARVAMPREDAVCGIHRTSNNFERSLHDFLGKDFHDPDRTPYPDTDSLVGDRGEFILYKLTGSPIFGALRSAIESMSALSENLLAETPGKAAFEWIRQAVEWIEKLNAAVTSDSPFRQLSKGVLVIPCTEARELLEEGKRVFLHVPEDLRRTISAHGIFVSTNKQEATLRVMFKKDGAHHSIGGTTLRWCPLLFDCLRNDVAALDKWESSMKDVLGRFRQFHSNRSSQLHNEQTLFKWHEFRSRLSQLLTEGREKLVVSPMKNFVDSFNNLLLSMEKYLEKFSTKSFNEKFERAKYETAASLVHDRTLLLEALLRRHALTAFSVATSKSASKRKSMILRAAADAPTGRREGTGAVFQSPHYKQTFRDTCRGAFYKAFRTASSQMGMASGMIGAAMRDEFDACCSIKSWEIEKALFDRFQKDAGLARVTNEYRDKARSLRYNFEDKTNLTLCLRVLVGEIPVSQLVEMTPEQLASRQRRSDREKATVQAQQQVMLTKNIAAERVTSHPDSAVTRDAKAGKSVASTSPSRRPITTTGSKRDRASLTSPIPGKNGRPTKKISLGRLTGMAGLAAASKNNSAATSERRPQTQMRAQGLSQTRLLHGTVGGAGGNRNEASEYARQSKSWAPSLGANEMSHGQVGGSAAAIPSIPSEAEIRAALAALETGKSQSGHAPPPPPPPLRMSNAAESQEHDRVLPFPNEPAGAARSLTTRDASVRVSNASGNDRFRIEVNGKLFFGHLLFEGVGASRVGEHLPESLKDKGRLRVDELTRFLSDKLRSGRWKAIALRLLLESGVDSQSYKRFYREYETKHRVAMFSVSPNTKLFLVTPKFHDAVVGAGIGVSLSDQGSTYAVILTKEPI